MALLVFFYALLPLANALADWLSLIATRWFLSDMMRRKPGARGLIGHVLLDLIVGALCLFALLGLLVGLLALWNMLHPASLPLDWYAYWTSARANWRDGAALWLICATTLLPTFIHVVWALTVWQTQQTAPAAQAVAMMQTVPPEPEPAWCNEVAALLWRARVWGVLRAAVVWVPVTAALLVVVAVWWQH